MKEQVQDDSYRVKIKKKSNDQSFKYEGQEQQILVILIS